MATWRYIVYDIWESNKETFDDAEVGLQQVIYWCQIVANNLKYQHLQKRKTGSYLTFVELTVAKGNGYCYSTLPGNIFDLDNDEGVDFITYNRYVNGEWLCIPFNWIKPARVHRVKMSPYEKPSPSNPYFYRVSDDLHFLGIDSLVTTGFKVIAGLYLTIPVGEISDLDAEIPLNEEHVKFLKYEVEQLIRWSLIITPEKFNDGADKTAMINAMQKSLGRSLQPGQQQESDTQTE